jgi:hypothetical protein
MFRRRYKRNGGYIGDWRLQDNTGIVSPLQDYTRHTRVPDWYRPSDWLPMPDMPVGTQMFAGLAAIYKGASGFTGASGDSNFVALLAVGNYIVDWGNGFTSAHTSNTQANYQYNFEDIPTSTETRDGYRQVIIKVTPQAGATLTQINLNRRYSGPPTQPIGWNPWLSIRIRGRQLTTIGIGSSSPTARNDLLEEIEILGETSISGIADILQNVTGVECIKGTEWTSSCSSANSCFTSSLSLRKIPLLDTRRFSSNTHAMFSNCNAFELCPPLYFDGVNDSSVINTSSLFNSTGIIIAPHLSLRRLNQSSSTTNGSSSMFSGCSFLKRIPETLDFTKNRFFNSMFASCVVLSKIPNINTINGTNFSAMFDFACSLNSVSGLCMGNAHVITNMFDEAYRLKSIDIGTIGFGLTAAQIASGGATQTNPNIAANDAFFRVPAIKAPELNWSKLSTALRTFRESRFSIIPGGGITSGMSGGATLGWSTNSFLYQALALKSFPVLDGLLQNIDIRELNASPTMLNQIFTGLGTTGGRINVTSNWGACAAYGCCFGIATSKGWTFTNV